MRRVGGLLLVAALACTGPDEPRVAPSPSASSPVSATPTATPNQGVVVAVERRQRGVELYRVGADRKAVRVMALRPPAPYDSALTMTLSAGPSPDVCVVWATTSDSAERGALYCHRFGDADGVRVGGIVGAAALRPDGSALAWTEYPTPDAGANGGGNQDLVTARYAAGAVTGTTRHPTYRDDGSAPEFGCDDVVEEVVWVDERRVLLECIGANDYPGGLVVQDLRAGGRGREVEDTARTPYNFLTRPAGADATTVLAVQGEWCEIECAHGRPPAPRRAVRVALATGRVVEVVATPLASRGVASVSGGPRGIVYVTTAGEDLRVYLRLPGERRGVRVTGLPGGITDDVVAQP